MHMVALGSALYKSDQYKTTSIQKAKETEVQWRTITHAAPTLRVIEQMWWQGNLCYARAQELKV